MGIKPDNLWDEALPDGDSELDERLIRLLGWRCITIAEPITYEVSDHLGRVVEMVCDKVIVDAEGEEMSAVWPDEELAWEHCSNPQISSDLNLLYRLADYLGLTFTVKRHGYMPESLAIAYGGAEDKYELFTVSHLLPAIAGALALEQYLIARNARIQEAAKDEQ